MDWSHEVLLLRYLLVVNIPFCLFLFNKVLLLLFDILFSFICKFSGYSSHTFSGTNISKCSIIHCEVNSQNCPLF